MKKILIMCIIILMPMSSGMVQNTIPNELEDIIDIVLKNKLEIDDWEVTIKESMSLADGEDIIRKLKQDDKLTLNEKENERSIIYSFSNGHFQSDIVETYNVIFSKQSQESVEFIAVLKGHTWNGAVKGNYHQWYHLMMTTYFTKLSRSFTCLTTAFSDIINEYNLSSYIMDELDIQHNQIQYDNNESSTLENVFYGYTPLWSQKVNMGVTQLNLQMAVRKNESGARKFIIGTPILINEY